jgi:hypothetical protein
VDFKVEKCLRQGDPLSPLLFLIAVECIIRPVNRAVELDYYKGFNFSDNLQFNILQFVDDTILVGEDNWENRMDICSMGRGNDGNIRWFSYNVNIVCWKMVHLLIFGREKWIGGIPLCFEFSHIFCRERNKEVRYPIEAGGREENGCGNMGLDRGFVQRSCRRVVRVRRVQGFKPNTYEDDQCRMIVDYSCNFTTQSCHNFLALLNHSEILDQNIVRTLNEL